MTPAEAAQHHALPADHLEALAPQARRIAEILGGLSMVTSGEPWRRQLEHDVWQAIQGPEAGRAAVGLDARGCAELRQLARQAGGWVIWLEGLRFVRDPTWRLLHGVWRTQQPAPR